jgi:hypothetical protein
MLKSMEGFYREAAEQWCHFAHSQPMWPVNGEYRCPTCHRTYPVPWANTPPKLPRLMPVGQATHRTQPKAA